MEMSCLIAILFHVAKSLDTVAEFGSDPTITQQYKAPPARDGFHIWNNGRFKTMWQCSL